jgi:hypothetical protein
MRWALRSAIDKFELGPAGRCQCLHHEPRANRGHRRRRGGADRRGHRWVGSVPFRWSYQHRQRATRDHPGPGADDRGRMGCVQPIADTKTEKIAGRPCRARARTPDGAGTIQARCAAQEVNEQ